MIINIGTQAETGKPITLNLQAALSSHLMLEGNTNAGKSYTVRVIAEQVIGKMPHILIDPEGEYASLRDKFPYLLCGEGGEVQIRNETAPKLAETLIENGMYAIINLYGMERDQQYEWLGIFLRKLMHLPRTIWKPTIITIDEMHRFAPEQGQAEKKNEAQQEVRRQIKELFSAGGKRGYLGICATQRWAKVDKSAIAEIQNYLVGKTFYPEDIERAAKALGIPTRKELFEPFSADIRQFSKGQFYAFGSALSETLVKVQINKALTKHPERGKPNPAPPPTPESIKALLPKLAAIPQEMEKEEHERGEAMRIITERHEQIQALNSTINELRERLHVAESNISADKADQIAQFTRQQMLAVIQPFLEAIGNGLNRLVTAVDGLAGEVMDVKNVAEELRNPIQGVMTSLTGAKLELPPTLSFPSPAAVAPPITTEPVRSPRRIERAAPARAVDGDLPVKQIDGLGKIHTKILTVLAQYPQGRNKRQIATLAVYSSKGGAFRRALGELRSSGYITGGNDGVMKITPAGLKALGSWQSLPHGHALLQYWYGELATMEASILKAVATAWPRTITKEQVAQAIQKEASGGAFRRAMGHLRTLELITGREHVKASDELFG